MGVVGYAPPKTRSLWSVGFCGSFASIGTYTHRIHGIFTYIWLILMANVGKSTIHGLYGIGPLASFLFRYIWVAKMVTCGLLDAFSPTAGTSNVSFRGIDNAYNQGC